MSPSSFELTKSGRNGIDDPKSRAPSFEHTSHSHNTSETLSHNTFVFGVVISIVMALKTERHFLFLSFFVFYDVAQAGLKLSILLPQPPKC
jgi:hypothetical protein